MCNVSCNSLWWTLRELSPTLQFRPSLWRFLAFFSLFRFYGQQLHCFGSVSSISSTWFPAGSCFQWKSSNKPTIHYLLSTKQQTDTIRDKLVNIVEQLAAKEPHVFLGGDQIRAKIRVTVRLTFIRWTQTQLQMNNNIALWLLGICWHMSLPYHLYYMIISKCV